ncbi:MAG: VWA domain-containing protein [Bacteroidota bacterium]
MKRFLRIISFLPFILALLVAIKLYGKQLFASTPQIPVAELAAVTPVVEGLQVDSAVSTHRIQVALLLDVSNSMDGLIDQAKRKLWQVVNELGEARKGLAAPQLEISLIIYGGDYLDPKVGYVKVLSPMTADLDYISENLFSVRTNGGSEFCGKAIEKALALPWSAESQDLKMIFIAGNEPFNQGPLAYMQVCQQAALKDIFVNTIFCGNFQQGINTYWKHGAELTQGAYLNIDQNVREVVIETPYDSRLNQLNQELNKTYHYYGAKGKANFDRMQSQDQKAASNGSGYSRTLTKSKKSLYSNSSWDLVDAYKKDKQVVQNLKEDDEVFKNGEYRNKAELEKAVQALTVKRDSIQVVIGEVGKQRQQYIQDNQTTPDKNTLGNAMLKTIQEQAQKKAYRFEKK